MTRAIWVTVVIAGLAAAFVEFAGTIFFLALPAIASDFHAPVGQLTNAGSILAVGTLAGLPMAALADRRGRRVALAGAVGGLALANVLSGLAPTLPLLAVARLFAVSFSSVVLNLAIVVVAEASPDDRRGILVAVISLGAGAGAGLTSVLYPLHAPQWRYLYLAGGVGLLLAIAVWRLLPVSEAWRRAGHDESPLRVLLQPAWRGRLALLAAVTLLGSVAYQPGGFLGALFASRALRLPPLTISVILIVSAPLAVAGYLMGGRLSDRAGRRLPGTLLSAATALINALVFSGTLAAFWAGNLAWSLFSSAAAPILSAWFAELFPTRARASSQAVATVAGAAGGVIGLQFVGAVSPGLGLGPALVVVSVAALAGALLLLALPETRGRPLPS